MEKSLILQRGLVVQTSEEIRTLTLEPVSFCPGEPVLAGHDSKSLADSLVLLPFPLAFRLNKHH